MPADRILLAPITVTPTKPLTPTHLGFLLTLDVLRRATGLMARIDCVYHHRTYALTQQTMGFWAYLDHAHPGRDYTAMGEEEIGELYVRSHTAPAEITPTGRQAYTERVEQAGWLHPASARLLDLWEEHYRVLGLADPAMGRHGPPILPADQALDLLADRGLCLDSSALDGPVYLDATANGMPLRPLTSADGHANYLLFLLRELLPLIDDYDLIVLAYDRELRPDYQLVEHVLGRFGATVRRVEVNRVPIDGAVQSSRHGGWQGHTLPALRDDTADLAAFRLGLRLYLIAVLGRGGDQSFRHELLRRWVGRARSILDAAEPDAVDLRAYLGPLAAQGYVDPYRLSAGLLRRHAAVPVRALAEQVFAAGPPTLSGMCPM